MNRLLCSAFVAAVGLLTPVLASAHSLWIEPLPDGGLGVRFAEWGDEYEKSPGHLDSFTQVSGWAADAEGKPVVVETSKKSDHFLLGDAKADKPIQAQAYFTVRQMDPKKPARGPVFYARWQPAGAGAGTPGATLDIVPTGKAGEARVYFRGKPLGGVKLSLQSPGNSEKELTADAEGLVKVEDVSKKGLYQLAVARYSEDLPGFFNGMPYAILSHSSSLCWEVK